MEEEEGNQSLVLKGQQAMGRGSGEKSERVKRMSFRSCHVISRKGETRHIFTSFFVPIRASPYSLVARWRKSRQRKRLHDGKAVQVGKRGKKRSGVSEREQLKVCRTLPSTCNDTTRDERSTEKRVRNSSVRRLHNVCKNSLLPLFAVDHSHSPVRRS